MDMATQASYEPMLHGSLEGLLRIIETAFLDSIVFFTILGLCIQAPKLSLRIIQSTTRWNFNSEHQEGFCLVSAIGLTLSHALLSMLFAIYDDSGVSPNAPSVFWAILWSSGIMAGVAGGFTVASVVAILVSDALGL